MEVHQLEFVHTLIQGYKHSGSTNGFKFHPKSMSSLSKLQDRVNGFKLDDPISDPNPSNLEGVDFTDATLKYISEMLMEEEDLEHKPCMFQDCMALQAAEKSFYDVLGEKYPPNNSPNHHPHQPPPPPQFTILEDNPVESSLVQSDSVLHSLSLGSPNSFSADFVDWPVNPLATPFEVLDSSSETQSISREIELEKNGGDCNSPNGSPSKGKKNHCRDEDDDDYVEEYGRSSKLSVSTYSEESEEQSEMYDEVLLCHPDNASRNGDRNNLQQRQNGGRPRGKRVGDRSREVVDLETLLTQCAQSVASNDFRTASEQLQKIRNYSSPGGNGSERLAHFFANALDARLSGCSGTSSSFTAFAWTSISAADILKGYQAYVKASPFKKLSISFANQSIVKLSMRKSKLHIIDFGILYGFQWPCLIQRLSARPGGPPKLRITGIEFPQPGFRPAERVEETGRRLAKYCKRFNVQFEYKAIAKKWDTIQLDDLRIDDEEDEDEVLVVNCLFRLKNVVDETVAANSPRDNVLALIKRLNPHLFIHGVVNGMYNAPFFSSRFREALFHFSALFDMFDANVGRDDEDRMLFEREVFGRDVVNIIACEGLKRVERPETYKQWQVRNVRAGFRPLPLDREIVKDVKRKVKLRYNNGDFVVDEDGSWMLQGWKGRIICGISCWKPDQRDF